TSTQAGKDAFAKIAQGLTSAELAAISAAARMSGLRTEIITLPDGRTVEVVIEADKSQLDSAKAAAQELAFTKWTGTVTFLGDPRPAEQGIYRIVQLADGTRATMVFDAD